MSSLRAGVHVEPFWVLDRMPAPVEVKREHRGDLGPFLEAISGRDRSRPVPRFDEKTGRRLDV